MGGMPWPEDNRASADIWGNPTLGGYRLPGCCKVHVTGGVELDKGKASGKHRANVKRKGQKPREVTIDWKVWSETQADKADWELMQEILENIESPDGKKDIQPFVIFHPATFARGVNSVLIEDIDGPNWEEPGFMVVKLKCVEADPPPASAKGTGKVGTPKMKAPGSEWEQAPTPDKNAIWLDKDGNQIAVKNGEDPPSGATLVTPGSNGEPQTTATKNKPSKTNAGP